jgi:hypothetical protein
MIRRMMNIRIWVLSASLFASTCGGQQPTTPAETPKTPDSCPILVTKIDPTGNETFGHVVASGKNASASNGRMFVLKVQNTSGKDIKGMKFQAAYYDAIEDLSDIPVAWQWTDPLKAGDEKSFRWENSWREEARVGWKVRLTKVLFEDGSKWEPVAGQTCSGEYWRDKHHK